MNSELKITAGGRAVRLPLLIACQLFGGLAVAYAGYMAMQHDVAAMTSRIKEVQSTVNDQAVKVDRIDSNMQTLGTVLYEKGVLRHPMNGGGR